MSQSNANSEITLKSDSSLKETVASMFNSIRFPNYRIASKLRYLQKSSNFYLIDQFNTLEAFREFGLNGNLDLNSLVANSQIHSIIYSLFAQLSQRLPSSQELNIQKSADIVYNWIVETFDVHQSGFTNIFALKIALILLCSATYSNKLRYLFTLLSNDGQFLIESHFDLYIRYILAIAQYFEDISIFFYDEDLHSSIFNFSTPINLQQFIEVLTCFENQADFTAWLIVYHRLGDAERVTHQTNCNACRKNPFQGFRYKCKKCNNYNLCQECFWTGKTSGNHDPDKHPCKEYLFEKPKNQFRRSIRKSFRNSFRCAAPPKQATSFLQNEDNLTRKQLNLTSIISSPLLRKSHSMRKKASSSVTYQYRFYDLAFDSSDSVSNVSCDEEHTLIAHYLNLIRNKSEAYPTKQITSTDLKNVNSFEKTIEQLESKNHLLMKRIAELKETQPEKKQRNNKVNPSAHLGKSVFIDELNALRRKKDDLEDYLDSLQDRKKVLMVQLDNLMKEFKDFDDTSGDPFELMRANESARNNNNNTNGQHAMDSLVEQFSSSSITAQPTSTISNHSTVEGGRDERELKSKAIISSLAFS